MKRSQVLLDTGPLVAFLNKADQHHPKIKSVFGQLEPPMLTCEAVLTEVCFLLAETYPQAIHSVLGLLKERGHKSTFPSRISPRTTGNFTQKI